MPNKNYLSGRRLEYEIIKISRAQGGKAMRTAGSHGWIDVIRSFEATGKNRQWSTLYPGFTLVSSNVDPALPRILVRGGGKYTDTLYIWIYRGHRGWYTSEGGEPKYPFVVVHLIQCKRKLNKKAKA